MRWLLGRTAHLIEGGAEPVAGLILPTQRFFPDRFDGDQRSVSKLLGRIAGHAGLDDLDLQATIVRSDDGGGGGSCSSGSCCSTSPAPRARFARVDSLDDGTYSINVAAGEVGHATLLTTALIRGITHIFLLEAQLYGGLERSEREPCVDLAGTLLGFGPLLCNGSYIYQKSCGGVQVHKATAMPVEELALATAIFCQLHQQSPRAARPHLDPTPRAHFDEATRWARANAGVVQLIRSDPAAVKAESYSLAEARGWLSRLLGLGKPRGPSVPTDDEIEKMASSLTRRKPLDPKKAARLRELRAEVDEALDS